MSISNWLALIHETEARIVAQHRRIDDFDRAILELGRVLERGLVRCQAAKTAPDPPPAYRDECGWPHNGRII
jgi:hypothetical protein